MSPRTKEQFSQIRNTSRNHIIDVALKLFSKQGYHATSISQIAAKAKISKGLMYNYFKSKDDLLKMVVHKGMDEIMQLTVSIDPGLSPKEKLVQLIELSFKHIKEYTAYWNLFISLILQPEVQKNTGSIIAKFREDEVMIMTDLFKQIGSKNPAVDAFSLGIQLDGIGLNYVAAPQKFPLEEMKDFLIEKYCK
jgi:AcrR family transcriptional regulator